MSASTTGHVDGEVDRTSVSTDPREAKSSKIQLIERLRDVGRARGVELYDTLAAEAADEIERLRELLRPFNGEQIVGPHERAEVRKYFGLSPYGMPAAPESRDG